jgi:hypothetical protein
MLEVLRLRQLRQNSEQPAVLKQLLPKGKEKEEVEEESDPAVAALLPARVLPPGSPIPLDVVALPCSADKLRTRRQLTNKELVRLQSFLPEPEPKRRTRSAGEGANFHVETSFIF